MTNESNQGGGSRPASVPSQPSRPTAERPAHAPAASSTERGASAGSSAIGTSATQSVFTPDSKREPHVAGPREPSAEGFMEQAREQAGTLASEAMEQTAELASQATEHVSSLVADQKRRAADHLHTVAGALREAAQRVGNDQLGGRVGQYASRAANHVDAMSTYVRTQDLKTFVRDTGQFARRRPELFVGGALLTGLLAARFLKASSGNLRRPGMPIGGR